jgi:PST family polysaccharide transporter
VIIQLIYIGILSRILTPKDFGIVAVINVFIVFIQLIADMGFGTAVIQNKKLTDEDISNIFSFSIYLGIASLLISMGGGYLIAEIYEESIYVSLGFVLSFSLAFNTFNMIPNAILLKERRFVTIAFRTVIVAILSFSTTIFLAVSGAGIYALAAQSVLNAIGLFLWSEITVRIKFKFKPSLSSIRKIWGYSVYQYGAQTLNYFNRNLDNLLIGKFLPKSDLGFYNKAYTLTQYPISYLPGIITPILHPVFSEYQDNKKYIYIKYMKILKIISLLGCFVSAFFFFAGREIIMIAFGSQWEASILPFRILSLSIWMQLLTNTMAPIYQSIGNTKLMFITLLITTGMIVSMIIAGITTQSIIYISIFISSAYILNFFISYFVLIRIGLKENYFKFLVSFRHEVLIFIVLGMMIFIWPYNEANIFVGFLVKFIAMTCIYGIMLFITQQHNVFLEFVKRSK